MTNLSHRAPPASQSDKALVEELLAHLGAAKSQLLPTDDQIVSGHIIAAHALALVFYRRIKQ